MKKFILGFIVGAAIMIPVTALGQTAYQKVEAYLNPEIKVSVEGEYISLESAPIVYQQRTYLPVRELVENVMGNEVTWVQETTTVEITNPDIWPVNDDSEGGGDVSSELDDGLTEEQIRKKESLRQAIAERRSEYFAYDAELDIDEIKILIQRIDSEIKLEQKFLEEAEISNDLERFPPYLNEEVIAGLEQLEQARDYWQSKLTDLQADPAEQPTE